MSDLGKDYGARLAEAWSDVELLIRRFQTLSAPGWESRRDAVVSLLQRLVRMSERLEQRAMPEMPEVASFALADAFGVVCGDVLIALESRADPAVLSDLIAELAQARVDTR